MMRKQVEESMFANFGEFMPANGSGSSDQINQQSRDKFEKFDVNHELIKRGECMKGRNSNIFSAVMELLDDPMFAAFLGNMINALGLTWLLLRIWKETYP